MLDRDSIEEMLDYNSASGDFVWKTRSDVPSWWNAKYAGRKAGSKDAHGYWVLRINAGTYKAHRIAWLLVTGEPVPPDLDIDHKDGDRLNNTFANLRLANDQQNAANARMRCDNRSGVKGVSWHRRNGKWQAQINESGKRHSLGYFDSIGAARDAYEARAKEVFGDFAPAGRSGLEAL
jgi:hypothetical protein